MENQEPVTEEEFMEAFHRLPEEYLKFWKKHLDKCHGQEFGYVIGYIVGMKFVSETMVKPFLDRVDKVTNGIVQLIDELFTLAFFSLILVSICGLSSGNQCIDYSVFLSGLSPHT